MLEKVVLTLVDLCFPLYFQVVLFPPHIYMLPHRNEYIYLGPSLFLLHFYQLVFFHKPHQWQLEAFVHQENILLVYKYNKNVPELHTKQLNILQLIYVVQILIYLYLYKCLAQIHLR